MTDEESSEGDTEGQESAEVGEAAADTPLPRETGLADPNAPSGASTATPAADGHLKIGKYRSADGN